MKINLVSKTLTSVALAAFMGLAGCCAPIQKAPEQPKPKPVAQNYNWLADRTTHKDSSMVLIEKMGPQTVIKGQNFDYTIKVTNLTDYKLDNVVVTEKVNDQFTIKSATPPVTSTDSDGAHWALGMLDPHETKTIVVTVSATGTGQIINCAKVKYEPLVCIATNVINPDLALDLDSIGEALSCDVVPVTFVVSNPGTGLAQNVTVAGSLPANLMTVDGMDSFSMPVGSLDSGQSQRFVKEFKAAKPGTYKIQAKATANGGLEDMDEASVVLKNCELQLSLDGPEKVYITKDATYNLTVKNVGNGVAKNAMVRLSTSPIVSFSSATGGGSVQGSDVVWNLGSLNPNESKSLSMTGIGQTKGVYNAQATASAYCCGDVSKSTSTDVLGIAALLLEVIDVEDPVRVGNNETYIITVTNQGSAVANNIVIKATLEDSMEFVSASGDANTQSTGQTIIFSPLNNLQPKAQATYRVVVKAKTAGDVRFTVELTSNDLTRPVQETESTHQY